MDPFTTNNLETITRGRWQWRSNSDPWSKAEEPQWEPYSLEHNYLIEKGYYDQRKEVDLGIFLVYPLEMLQRKKGTPEAQRPIRRIDWVEYEELNDRSSRYFETELPKTLNKIFGSLEDFISFFGRRNAEISGFQKEFCSFEESKDLDVLKNRIIPPLISCLENELLSSILEQLQDPSLSTLEKRALLKKKERHENLTLLFQKDFSSVEEFYGNILKSYTMNSSLYANLNRYLRNESWVKIDNLLPYIFCLCKAFFNIKPNTQEQNFLLLYRGTALDEAALMTYSMKKDDRYFSWFSVTSTSRNVKIAQEFMFRSVNIKEKKTPVMFIIEVPISEEQVNWIDIKQYSVISKEDEVILAPGSVFELVEISSDQDGLITTIKLKLKGEVQSLAHGGMMMQGALQSQMMTEKEAKIMCLEGEELSQALMSLHGNQLIEELEFCLCTFDKKLQEEIFEILPMLQRIKILRFIACTSSEGSGEITNQGEQSKIIKIQVIEANSFFHTICNEKRGQTYWSSLRELELDFGSRRNLKDKELEDQVSQGLKYLPQLTSLKINFEGCYEITDDGIKSLSNSLNSLTQLVHLNIRFFICMNITDSSAKYLAKGLSSLTRLAHLDMKFESCRKITDEAADNLAKGFNSLTQLTYLSIKFRQCGQMTGNAVNIFASQALKFLSKLNSLNLDFDCVENSRFLSQELRSLTQLTSLTLENLYYDEKELTSFVSDGLKSLLQLTSLTISLWRSSQYKHITDEALTVFASQGLKPFLSLTSLDLSFYYYGQITDKGVSILASQGLKYLSQLKSLALEFYSCDQITEEGVNSLMSQGIQSLTQLTSLTLNFPFCDHVTEKGMKTLAAKWLRNLRIFESLTVEGKQLKTIDIQTQQQSKSSSRMKLTRESSQKYKQSENDDVKMASNSPKSIKQSKDLIEKLITRTHEPQSTLIEIFPEIHQLTSLNFSFEMNSKIVTDEFVQNLAAQVLSHCPQLTCLTLNFNYCYQITDKGILDLGLKHLSQLRSLHLQFFECNRITAEGWMNLASNGLRHLSQLESLVLRPCTEISDEGVRNLAIYGLKPLVNLASLNLDFSHCQKITDQGMMNLANEGLRHLSQLKSLTLEFVYCERFTHEGWVNLAWNGLRHLPQLESLVLKSCQEITDKGVDSLVTQGFKYLTQLKSLSLDFSVSEITDKGVNILILQVVKNLPQLVSLDLDFHDARNISDFTIQNVIRVLHYFGFTKKIEEADENGEI